MKKTYFKLLTLIFLISSLKIQASPFLGKFLRTATPVALGATVGYNVTNDITNAVKAKQYGIATELTTLATLGAGMTASMGTLLNIHSQAIDSNAPRPIESGSIASLNQRMGSFARSARLGSLAALATPLCMLVYHYAKPSLKRPHNAQSNIINCEPPKEYKTTDVTPKKIEEIQEKAFWTMIGSKFSIIPGSMKAKYHKMALDGQIDRRMLIGNK